MLDRLGWVQYAAAELPEVLDTNQQAFPLYRSDGRSGGESISFNDLGRAYLDLGEVASRSTRFSRR